jgi:alcohol dehydrogenase YqhD (iron-dependent ADH family)
MKKEMFVRVQYQYFNKKGEQKTKVLEGTLKTVIKKMDAHLQKNELYEISHVSPNIGGYDWEKHGEHFKGWK